MLGDSGIEPTAGLNDLGNRSIPWMPDRLDTFIGLLCDADVLKSDDNDRLSLGSASNEIRIG